MCFNHLAARIAAYVRAQTRAKVVTNRSVPGSYLHAPCAAELQPVRIGVVESLMMMMLPGG